MKYLKPYNESIRHLLKPKNKEDILKQLSKLSPLKQIEKSVKYDILNRDELRKILFKLNDKHIINTGLEYDLLDKDEILKYSKKLSREQKLTVGSKYNILPLIKSALKKPSFFSFNDDNLEQSTIIDGFINACYRNNIDVVKYYLDEIIEDVSFRNNYCLKISSEKGNLQIVKMILNHHTFKISDKNADKINTINLAAKNDHFDVIDYLLKDNRFKNIKFPKISIDNLMLLREYDNLKKLLGYKEITKDLPDYSKFHYGCRYDILYLVKDAIKEGYKPKLPFSIVGSYDRTKIVKNSSEAIAVKNGYTEIIEYIIDNTYFDASDYDNILIKIAHDNKRYDIVDILLRDKKVNDKLESYEKDFYENEISHLYESIRHLLKPKSPEYIKNATKNLSTQDKLEYGYEYNIIDLFKQGLDDGANPFNLYSDYIKDSIIDNKVDIFRILFSKYKDKYHFYDSLMHACSIGNLEIVKILLENGKFGFEQYYPIVLSSKNGNLNVVKELLKYKEIDPSALTNKAIKEAYKNEHKEVVRLLLNDDRVRSKLTKKSIDKFESYINDINESIRHLLKPKNKDDIKTSILHINTDDRLHKIYKYKTQDVFNEDELKGFLLDIKSPKRIIQAHRYGLKNLLTDDDILECTKKVEPKEKLRLGLTYNIPILIKQSLMDGVDPSFDNQSTIKFVSEKGYDDIIKILLKDNRVNPSVNDNWSIGLAAENGHLEIVKLLMNDKRVDPSDDNNFAIKFSLRKGHLDIVQELLKDKRVVDKLSLQDKIDIKQAIKYKYDTMFNSIDNWIDKRKRELE